MRKWCSLVGAIIAASLLGGINKTSIVRKALTYNALPDRLTVRPAVTKLLKERVKAVATIPAEEWFGKLLQDGQRPISDT